MNRPPASFSHPSCGMTGRPVIGSSPRRGAPFGVPSSSVRRCAQGRPEYSHTLRALGRSPVGTASYGPSAGLWGPPGAAFFAWTTASASPSSSSPPSSSPAYRHPSSPTGGPRLRATGVSLSVLLWEVRASLYAIARAAGLSDLERRVDLVERSVRRGEGDPELARALDRDAEGD